MAEFNPDWVVTENAKSYPELLNRIPFDAIKENQLKSKEILLQPKQGTALAWHFSWNRQTPCATIFYSWQNSLWTDKRALNSAPSIKSSGPQIQIEWSEMIQKPYLSDPLVSDVLFEGSFEEELLRFLKHSLNSLTDTSLDALFINAVKTKTSYEYFDLEWRLVGSEMSKSWWIFRNFFALGRYRKKLSALKTYSSLKDGFFSVCSTLGVDPEWELNLKREAELQSLATLEPRTDHHYRELKKWFEARLMSRIATLFKR